MECENCKSELRIAILEENFKALTAKNDEEHKEFRENLKAIDIEQGKTQTNTNTILQAIYDLKADVKELKEQPANNWKTLIYVIISVVVSAIGTTIASSMYGG